MLEEWAALDYDIQVIDPGFDVEWERATDDRARLLVREWYAMHVSQRSVDVMLDARRSRLEALGLRSSPVLSSRPRW